MPIPSPSKGQDQKKFISSCMSNSVMKREFPKQKQRLAVCFSTFRRKRGGSKPKGKGKRGHKVGSTKGAVEMVG